MSETQVVETGYEPRKHQALLHRMMKRFNLLICHRRFGKTVFVLNEMIDQGLTNPRKNPQYYYFAPFYGQAKRVAWDYLKDFTKNIPGVIVNEAELRVDIPRPSQGDRVRFVLLGADNPGSIRGIYMDGCILDEYAEMDPTVWGQVIRPALSDRNGWVIFIGTPKGMNHFFDIYKMAIEDKEWLVKIYKASETKVIPDSELEAARRNMSQEEYDQEFECSFSAAVVGAYYAKQIDELQRKGRICSVPHDPNLMVDTYWDLGLDDSTAIWFVQQYGQEIRLIEYLEASGNKLEYYVKQIKERPYIINKNVLPWDAAARSLETGRTRQQTLVNLGLKNTYIQKRHTVEDGIHATRTILPRCWFDAVMCKQGLEALRHYQRSWDPKNKIFMSKPRHDWSSHGSDSFRYLALGVSDTTEEKELPRMSDGDYNMFGGAYGFMG